MSVDPDTIRYLAKLAMLHLDEQECAQMSAQLDRIVAFVRQLQEVAVDDVPPTRHVLDLVDAERADTPRPSLPRAQVMALAPAHEQGHFVVPRVIPKGEQA